MDTTLGRRLATVGTHSRVPVMVDIGDCEQDIAVRDSDEGGDNDKSKTSSMSTLRSTLIN